ncbi:MAG: polyprenyl synthetase family protein [Planctomycetes bacterium]|nr:polyprenyl synthetase family protein [Planctomycetota bacterium]
MAEYLARCNQIEPEIKKAIEYTLAAPGKRIRAVLVLWCCELCCGKINDDAMTAAVAVEMVHTYSLIHDDLPAMDDDDLRRGRPSCHKQFGEATAILTGDALLTMAFEMLASEIAEAKIAVRLIRTLSESAGAAGMIAGQMADIAGENSNGGLDALKYIHINKTAKMFAGAATMGAICGKAGEKQIENLCTYGLEVGLGFQIADDILDISATSQELGKTAGKDTEQGKMTYPAIIGLDRARETAFDIAEKAVAALQEFGSKADILRLLALELAKRTH